MPKRTGEGPKPHPHDSTLGESSREAQTGRRLLGTNGGSLWLCAVKQEQEQPNFDTKGRLP